MYVSDSKNHRIVVFTPEGRFVTSFGADVENFVPNPLTADGRWGMCVSRTYAITDSGRQLLTDYPLDLSQ